MIRPACRPGPRPGAVSVIKKPWGREILYARHPRYAGKVIVVNGGHRLSLQYHVEKHETIFVLDGRLVLRLGERSRVLKAGMAAAIPPRTVHRFEARFGRVTVLEASTPELDDVVRLEDDYGRTSHSHPLQEGTVPQGGTPTKPAPKRRRHSGRNA
ncbi:MAG: cupin domain-containing protein [Elusimicrobia bacterium]|nr:cupin domain-containing protein [Elusimicrobiota bacterium]